MAGRITAIRVQKRNPNRASVFLDDQFAFGLELIEAAKLSRGQYLSDEEIAALQVVDEVGRAYEGALGFLASRPRSRSEVVQRLRKRGFPDPAIDAALERLDQAGLLDDRAFADYWIRNREQFRPRGRYALRQELRQKGIESALIDAALQDLDEAESAYRAAMQRATRWEKLDEGPALKWLSGYLQRRGFGYGIIQEVWARIQAERVAQESVLQESEDAEKWETL
jgi:regulatory protein